MRAMRSTSTAILCALLMAGAVRTFAAGRPPQATPSYEVFAVRFGTLPQYPLGNLVAGGDKTTRIDIPVMVWVLKSQDGKVVLVDAGFAAEKFVTRWKVQDFVTPAAAVARLGIQPEQVTDIVLTHMHWDHADGADLFPNATVWIQKEEYVYYTADAWQEANRRGAGADADVMAKLVARNMRGLLRFVVGDAQTILPGITCYTGGRHTFASQYVVVDTARGPIAIASDNVYLYENLRARAPIAQTLDAESNLRAQDRMRALTAASQIIVPGHDPAVFDRFPRVADGVVRIAGPRGTP
jgi:glyoxylase-like metal-dependent hydrolase (beta-lactamase superfamily II)